MLKRQKSIKPWKIVLFVCMLLPMILGITYALLYSFGLVGLLNTGLTFSHWKLILQDFNLWKSLGFSLSIGLVSISLSFILALGMIVYWRKAVKTGRLSTLIYFPLAFPATVVGFYTYQSLSKTGLWSRIAYQVGLIPEIESFPALVNDAYGIGIILGSCFIITPFLTLILKEIFESEHVDKFENIAESLGANRKHILRKVTIPILFNKVKASLLLFLIFVIGSYEIPLLLGRQNPKMITVAIVDKAQRFNLNDIPQAYAMAIIYILFLVSLFYGIQKLLNLKPLKNE